MAQNCKHSDNFGFVAGALNFKDVMLAYGKLPRDAMGSAGKLFSIGLEFSGQVRYLQNPCSISIYNFCWRVWSCFLCIS